MYQDFVREALFWAILRILAFPLIAVFVYFGTGVYREADLRWRSLLLLGIAFGALTAIQIFSQLTFMYDYVRYLWEGDTYVYQSQCQVVSALSLRGAAMTEISCVDGQDFVVKYRDYRQLAWQWALEKKVLRIFYLPRSRLVLRAVPVD